MSKAHVRAVRSEVSAAVAFGVQTPQNGGCARTLITLMPSPHPLGHETLSPVIHSDVPGQGTVL